jgi:hypothetical protein
MSSPTKLGTIVTQNSTLRQLIRQASVNKDLEKRFKAFPSIQTIRVKVAVSDRSQSAPETKRANPISGSSAVSLQHCADQVNYPALKDALLRLKRRESSEH